MRTPSNLAIPVEKATNTVRIFVLGESAALGDPLPKFGFSRMLERLLQARFPEKQFEIVNVAMTAINSHVILPIARDCAKRDGDLWLVYMGNNEVVGPFGPGTVLGPSALSLGIIRANLTLKGTRVGQCLDTALERLRGSDQPQYWKGMELMAQRKVPRADSRMASVYRNFRRNLDDILRVGTRAGVPILLCTVGANLRDCPPFASLHPKGFTRSEEAKWTENFNAGLSMEGAGQWAEAVAHYEHAARLDSAFAELPFHFARCFLALGRDREAFDNFQKALDVDALRFRADSEINRIIRDVAREWGSGGVRFLDAEEMFARNSPQGIAGEELFYEHVHLTPQGNYLLARATAEAIARVLFPDRTRSELSQPADRTNTTSQAWLSQAECERQIGYTEWNRSQALRVVLDRMQLAPFVGTIDHTNRVVKLQREVNQLMAENTPTAYKAQAEQVREAVAAHPDDWLLRENLGLLLSMAQDMAGAEEQLRTAIKLMPHASTPQFSLAGVLALEGKTDEAIRCYHESLRLEPDNFHAWMRLGIVELNRRRFPEAITYLRSAIRTKPDSIAARLYLGGALMQVKQTVEAQEQFREVLRLEPNNPDARRLLESAGGAK